MASDGSDVTMDEARARWATHTRHVLTREARAALRGARWLVEDGTPVLKGAGLTLAFVRFNQGVVAEARWA